ncbi:O-methyltransferase [Salinimicrobium flavum]|uniref:O-methyltransferase n=1 Tax=Salinimicrobium flavum TaxID=1737065 RepID=A0ABW5IYE7_9FLAO
MHIIFAYIKFLLRSTNQHGVHSPFVFNLVTKCFYDKKEYPAYAILKQYRRALRKDKRIIKIKDFGAGSRTFRSDERRVSEIAKNAGISTKRARLLNRLVRYLKVDRALELGTSLGLGTSAMAAGNEVKITTIEGCLETAAIAKEQFDRFNFSGIEPKVGKFEAFLEDSGQRAEDINSKSQIFTRRSPGEGGPNSNFSTTDNPQPTTYNRRTDGADLQSVPGKPNSILNTQYSLLYIDGNHRKEATLRYFEKLLPTVHNDTVMIFDDIHWSAGMEEAWEEIKKHPSVTVTIDTFFWGLVFFRQEQEKEHFVIRV